VASGIDANYERKQDERQTFAALMVWDLERDTPAKSVSAGRGVKPTPLLGKLARVRA